jgi:hypothetical protein
MKTCGGVETYLCQLQWSASRPSRFTLGERGHRYQLDRTICGPQSRSRHCEIEKNLAFAGNRTPAVQAEVHLYTD